MRSGSVARDARRERRTAMSTHAAPPRALHAGTKLSVSKHWAWLAGGLAWAFLVPYVFADVLAVDRDLYYGIYVVAVVALLAAWTWDTKYDLRAALVRRWPWALVLGIVSGAVLAAVVLRSEDATPRPMGVELIAQVGWRGIVYGLADGLLLSVFPILAVFAAFSGTRWSERMRGKVAIGAVALVASLLMTAVYHAGYSDFRSEKIRKPLVGDVVWSVPTLVTLNPIGSPIAHATMHTTAVLHSYETDTFLPPHR
jgi:hypothetical protein